MDSILGFLENDARLTPAQSATQGCLRRQNPPPCRIFVPRVEMLDIPLRKELL